MRLHSSPVEHQSAQTSSENNPRYPSRRPGLARRLSQARLTRRRRCKCKCKVDHRYRTGGDSSQEDLEELLGQLEGQERAVGQNRRTVDCGDELFRMVLQIGREKVLAGKNQVWELSLEG